MNTELNTTPALLVDEHVNGEHDDCWHHDCRLCNETPKLKPAPRTLELSASAQEQAR